MENQNQNQTLEVIFLKELNSQSKYTNISKMNSIYDIYPDFNWITYRDLNPYLYIIGLRDDKEYIHNYLLEGRYKGRIYKESQNKDYSFHVLLATIGKESIFKILKMLDEQLTSIDYLTIVFDGKDKSKNIIKITNYVSTFKCKVNIIVEEENLGYWGHGIRNKHNDLEGDFVFHIDDDDLLCDNSFDIIRKHCKDTNIIYIFKIMLENGGIVWKTKSLKYSHISTQSGIIPTHINKNGYWELKYGGDFDFYKNIADRYHILFIDNLIYKKIGDGPKIKN